MPLIYRYKEIINKDLTCSNRSDFGSVDLNQGDIMPDHKKLLLNNIKIFNISKMKDNANHVFARKEYNYILMLILKFILVIIIDSSS